MFLYAKGEYYIRKSQEHENCMQTKQVANVASDLFSLQNKRRPAIPPCSRFCSCLCLQPSESGISFGPTAGLWTVNWQRESGRGTDAANEGRSDGAGGVSLPPLLPFAGFAATRLSFFHSRPLLPYCCPSLLLLTSLVPVTKMST